MSSSTSFIDLFLGADIVVKLVMLGLIVASVFSWAIIILKTYKLRALNSAADKFEELFWSGTQLDDIYHKMKNSPDDPMSNVFVVAMKEWSRSSVNRSKELQITLTQRIDRVMHLTINREMETLEKNLGFLLSLGSNGMIVGLFGTVLGIMHSFESIASEQNTNLFVVAPSIAEALFATAIGLIAAIPASIIYNKLSSDVSRYGNRLNGFATEFGTIISRHLEETH